MVVTVKELIETLEAMDPDLPVALSIDEEGNNIHLIHGVGISHTPGLDTPGDLLVHYP